jgi:hypothetical protein
MLRKPVRDTPGEEEAGWEELVGGNWSRRLQDENPGDEAWPMPGLLGEKNDGEDQEGSAMGFTTPWSYVR